MFRAFGTTLLNLPPIAGSLASMHSTWTMGDDAGYTITEGTLVGFSLSGDDTLVFQVVDTFTVPPGNTATAAGAVVLEAVEAGARYNGVPVGPLTLIDALSFVDLVSATTVSSGGADAEADSDYLNRLATELQLLTPRPILSKDFAILAGRVPGVHRALAISGYNPDDNTTGNERYVAVALTDTAGAAVSVGIKADVEILLESLREVNFVIKTLDPTYTTINTVFTIHTVVGTDSASVLAAASAAVTSFLSPANYAGGDRTPPEWDEGVTKVRYLELAAAIARVDGVQYVASLTLNGGTTDVTMTGKAPLPTPGTVSGTVV